MLPNGAVCIEHFSNVKQRPQLGSAFAFRLLRAGIEVMMDESISQQVQQTMEMWISMTKLERFRWSSIPIFS
jgi:hypothetical protein